MTGVSVVIPCYNSAQRLPQALGHLAAQHVPSDIDWEVIVVDNASNDDTARIAEEVWAGLGSNVPFRVVAQPIKGLSAARTKGFEAARFGYVLFCDDDNWLSRSYVALSHSIMEQNPGIGALGGKGSPACEGPPPDWFEQYSHYYAVGPQGSGSGEITAAKGYVYGAGSVTRKNGWQQLLDQGFEFLTSDRLGTSLTGGGDVELCFALRLLGYKIWYDERLTFQHALHAERLTWPYFLRLTAGAHESGVLLAPYDYALRKAGLGGRPASRYRWLVEVKVHARGILGHYRWILRAKRNGGEYSSHIVQMQRRKAALKGWVKLRSRYAREANRLAAFRSAFEESAK